MSPEDDHHQGEQVTSNNDALNRDDHWPSAKHVSPKNGVINPIGNGNGYVNSTNKAILKPNGNDPNTWLPLLSHHHANDVSTTNNNKWPVLTAPANLSNSKYVWTELPQDDDSMGLYKPNLNAANALSGANGLNGKNEHESLTGVMRHPLNDYPNDEYYERSDCGIGFCKPRWASKFASTHVFMVIFLLAWILQVISIIHFCILHFGITEITINHTDWPSNDRFFGCRECILRILLVWSQQLRSCFKLNRKQLACWWVLPKLGKFVRRYFWRILLDEDIALDGLHAVRLYYCFFHSELPSCECIYLKNDNNNNRKM